MPGPMRPGRVRGTLGRLGGAWRSAVHHRPLLGVVLGFAGAVVVGTVLLLLPVSGHADLLTAVFTATSAVCVTGLTTVDTATAWTGFGQSVILLLIQLGGFGIMTFASLIGLLISRRLGLHTRLMAAASTRSVGLGDVRATLFRVAAITLVVEMVSAVALTARWVWGYHEPLGRAAWFGVFHAVSAFNNAGFSLFSDSLTGYATDPWIELPVTVAVLVGGLGFPVIVELLRRRHRPERWSLHTKVTLLMTAILVPLGAVLVLVAEWSNPATLGPMSIPGRVLASFAQGVMPRTAGFSVLDPAGMREGTWLGTDVLMFIGGGSASTAGGIKMTTFAVLAAVIWSELRGDPDVTVFDRRIPATAQRQAAAVALVGVATIIVPTIAIDLTSSFSLNDILAEVVSASATVGLSTGITPHLAPWHQLVLVVLMFAGRLGPISLGAALALRERARAVRYPEGQPIIG